jgi:pantoate--beta-alanine ligase
MTIVAHTRSEYREFIGRKPGKRAFVPTMGALHAGHLELVKAARQEVGPDGEVVVSIFVNPTQFGANEDLAQYPRPFHEDVKLCTEAGVDVVFAPLVEEMYPGGVSLAEVTSVQAGPVGAILEGASRPGHFAGMLTVVAKLFSLTGPDVAFFGEKDYQQLALVSAMVRDLNFPIDVRGVTTVRDTDGLALSSRNSYLSDAERSIAAAIPRALTAAQMCGGSVREKLAAAQAELVGDIEVTYLAAMRNDLQAELDPDATNVPGRILIAARVGTTHLIDNCPISVGA